MGVYIFTIVLIFLSTKRKGKYIGEHDSWKGRAALILYAEAPSLVLYLVCAVCAPQQGRPNSTHSRVEINLGPPFLPFLARSPICGKRLFRHVFPPVFPSISMEQLGSNWANFHEILHLSIFRKFTKKIQVLLNLTRITGILHEDQYRGLFEMIVGARKMVFSQTQLCHNRCI